VIEGFDYKTFPKELVSKVLIKYTAGQSYERIAQSEVPASFASIQRIVNEAVNRGVITAAQKRGVGNGGLKRERARVIYQKHPEAKVEQIARLAGCRTSTVYRAKRGE